MARIQELFEDLRINIETANKTDGMIARLTTAIAQDQRRLKSRKKRLWLDADGTGPDPAIAAGKNAEIREALHAEACAGDQWVINLRAELDRTEGDLNAARATLTGTKRDISASEQELATIRAELHVRAAEAFGGITAANGTATQQSPAGAAAGL